MENQHFLQPLIFTTTTSVIAPATGSSEDDSEAEDIKEFSSNSRIIFRLVSILFIGIVSIWANYEALKGFDITIINDAGDSPAGRRFKLLYVSNDKATRIVLNTSEFVEKILYPDTSHPKKYVNRITVRLASQNLTHMVVVDSSKKHEFVLHISPLVMEETNVNYAMVSAVQRGMARIWLWDGDYSAPPSLLDGMVEYISILAGFGPISNSGSAGSPETDNSCWEDKEPAAVAHFLNYCEGHRKGFIVRLNQAMKYGWHQRLVDDALRLPAQHLCASYNSSKFQLLDSLDSTSLKLLKQVF